TIDLELAGKHAEAIAIVDTGRGKLTMDRIRNLVSTLTSLQQARLVSDAADVNWAAQRLRIAASLTVQMAGALGWWAVAQSRDQILRLGASDARERTTNAKLLAEAEQREQLSDQLRHSQKMEAIGQLTGGVAHDFNNMLAVVIGSLNLLKRRLAKGETDYMRFIDGALDGAARAATLTHRLLAFSRQQPLAPTALDPNKMVAGMAEILGRTLGEQIRLETR
ncbi:MAG: histidine kinase, partial [Hyphomicrobiales bacterium]|nr:histidine kinase [Hyphomicrobiales bacterium]